MQRAIVFSARDVQEINNKLMAQEPALVSDAAEQATLSMEEMHMLVQRTTAAGPSGARVRATSFSPEKLNEYFFLARRMIQGI